MKRAYLLVEGPTDAEFLRRVLPSELLADVGLIVANGKARITSLARSLIAMRRTPIAVLMDADSVNPSLIDEQRQSKEGVISAAASSVPVKVVFAIPEIESWLFASPGVIERTIKEPVTADLAYLGMRDPRGVLQLLTRKNQTTWDTNAAIQALDGQDIERIREIPAVQELCQFLEAMQKAEQAA